MLNIPVPTWTISFMTSNSKARSGLPQISREETKCFNCSLPCDFWGMFVQRFQTDHLQAKTKAGHRCTSSHTRANYWRRKVVIESRPSLSSIGLFKACLKISRPTDIKWKHKKSARSHTFLQLCKIELTVLGTSSSHIFTIILKPTFMNTSKTNCKSLFT